ncbi:MULTISPECIES: hypothetical protein [Stenotrophomonas]|uniref:hypothetical protein n=1 Tax=Stenotrophomonas TaxID=40323 RepID=UPI0018D37462|nr:hypothetical protein [Stenotrophomonas sp.]MBH1508379.1 hypothetical protein [Stenotrophomonas maltophilia]
MKISSSAIHPRADRDLGQHRMLTKKLTKRCQSMPISAYAAAINEKAHHAKALMGFDISAI